VFGACLINQVKYEYFQKLKINTLGKGKAVKFRCFWLKSCHFKTDIKRELLDTPPVFGFKRSASLFFQYGAFIKR